MIGIHRAAISAAGFYRTSRQGTNQNVNTLAKRLGSVCAVMLTVWAAVPSGAQKKGAAPAAPILNKPAPEFSVAGLDGKARKLSSYRGMSVALFFFCGCEHCHRCARVWGEYQRSGSLAAHSGKSSARSLVVFDEGKDALEQFLGETALDRQATDAFPCPDRKVARSYKAILCPRVFVLDSKGVLRYTNNHKDDAPQEAEAELIMDRALQALLKTMAEKPVAKPR